MEEAPRPTFFSPLTADRSLLTDVCLKHHKPNDHRFPATLPVSKIHYIEVS